MRKIIFLNIKKNVQILNKQSHVSHPQFISVSFCTLPHVYFLRDVPIMDTSQSTLGRSIIGWRELNLWAESGSSYFKVNPKAASGFRGLLYKQEFPNTIYTSQQDGCLKSQERQLTFLSFQREKSKWKQVKVKVAHQRITRYNSNRR